MEHQTPSYAPPPARQGQGIPHVPTPATREKVKDLARVCTQGQIALLIGIDTKTLQKYYRQELDEAMATTAAAIGTKLVEKALTGHFASMAFYLSRRADWVMNHKVTMPPGSIRNFNFGDMSPEQLEALLPLLDKLIAGTPLGDEPDADT